MDVNAQVPAREALATGRLAAEASGGAVGVTYVTVLKSVGHEQLLAHYQNYHGEKQGEIELSNQFGDVFEAARTRAGVATESVARVPGAGHFVTPNADEADALATEMIRVMEERNAAVPNDQLHKKMVVSIVAMPLPEPGDNFQNAQRIYGDADELTREARPGEIRITDEVYQSLSAERRKGYTQLKSGERFGAVWHRVPGAAPVGSAERCVLVIDMARFSKIEARIALQDPENGSVTLRNQIAGIIAEGFRRAGAASYEQYMYKFNGDGGIFFFREPAVAHKVAVEILKHADEKNKRARELAFEDGMRCFRIGIDYGRLDRDGRNDFSGEVLARTVRLESGGPSGEMRGSAEFYRRLPEDLRKAYGDEEPVLGKDHDAPIPARRLAVGKRALWAEVGPDGQPYPPVKQPNKDFLAPEPVACEPCFVVCPLSTDQGRVGQVFDTLIAPACARAGFLPRRANELPGDRKVVIANNLANAPLVIAYLGNPTTGWNDNVILEVGFRLATGLPLVMLSDAAADGQEPEYQRLLPFQIAHHNVVTVGADPGRQAEVLYREIVENRSAKAPADWESPNPVLEFKFASVRDVILTDANEAARTLFGAENVRKNQSVEKLQAYFAANTDASQAEARRNEQLEILTKLWQRKTFGDLYPNWRMPRARIPVVFKDTPADPETGKPVGHLPVILRYSNDDSVTRVRYMYLRVSASLTKAPGAGYWVCEL